MEAAAAEEGIQELQVDVEDTQELRGEYAEDTQELKDGVAEDTQGLQVDVDIQEQKVEDMEDIHVVGHFLGALEGMLEVGGVWSSHVAGADIQEFAEDIQEFVEDIQEFVEDIQEFVEDSAAGVAGILGIDTKAGCQVQEAAGAGHGKAGGCLGRASGGCVPRDHWGRAGTWRRVALFTVRRPRLTLTGDKCLFVLGAEDAGQLSTLPRLAWSEHCTHCLHGTAGKF